MSNEGLLRPGLRVAITGGTSGLGRSLVRELVGRGARVATVARRAAPLEALRRALPSVVTVEGDVADKGAVHRIATELLVGLGGLDVLVHNASDLGPVPLRYLGDTDCEDLERALAVNVVGPQRLTRALLGPLVESARQGTGGLVVGISSDAAVSAYPSWGAYGASKAALAHMLRVWDEEMRPLGARFVSFDPGDMDTPMHAAALPDADPGTLKRPEASARELVAFLLDVMPTVRGPTPSPAARAVSESSGRAP